ncbi:UDP-glucosyltransferase 2-like isoform X2 [Zerene cesonia]|uniref:UDP-glucosyltransferase 2-like isoform X2 n=1 Tax=Zerene cesonia TaxID=33412 RepID=UPI0018E52DC1|nr:UDP-glucosyltransferase 2-like isoform X2 [Zerene cesonia]
MRCTFVIVILAIFINYVHNARILGLFAHTGKSHYMVFEPLLKELSERGHHVTVASFFPLQNPPANYTNVSLQGIANVGLETLNLSSFESRSILFRTPVIGEVLERVSTIDAFAAMALNICSKAVDWPPLVNALKEKYDVVLTESFTSDCMLGLLHVYEIKAPVIALSTCTLIPWVPDRIGVTNNPSYIPVATGSWTASMNFIQRIQNTLMSIYYYLWFHIAVQKKEKTIIEKHFGMEVPLYDLSINMTMVLVNTFHSLNGVRPLLPGLVEVGGMHLDHTRKPLPAYIERFLNESEHGVVLFSFGSLIKTSTIPKHKEEIIVKALSKLKQRVIWKYEDSEEEGTLSGNILKVRWLPQYELLRHKKVVAFIAHGGLLGMTEAVSAGKPMVVVPFFGDQPSNAASAEFAGFAKVLQYSELTEESLSAALESVLSAEMRLQARTVSKIWNDRQNPPLDTAVYWVERVLRWGPAAKLHSPARDLAFYEYALLDVAAAFIAIILVTLALLWYTLSKLSRMFLKESKQKLH